MMKKRVINLCFQVKESDCELTDLELCFFHVADGIPPDGTPIHIIHTYHIGLTTTYYLVAIAGILWAGVCAVFNFAFRKRKLAMQKYAYHYYKQLRVVKSTIFFLL